VNVISQTYRLSEDVSVTIVMRSQRVLTAESVRSYGILAEAAEKLAGAELVEAGEDQLPL
jgi:hypothetical protein